MKPKHTAKKHSPASPYRTQFGYVDFSIEGRARLKEGKQ